MKKSDIKLNVNIEIDGNKHQIIIQNFEDPFHIA